MEVNFDGLPVNAMELPDDLVLTASSGLDRLTSVTMKTQQQMWALRVKIIPRITYKLVLGQDTSLGLTVSSGHL